MKQEIVCIKLGGSVITDKKIPYHAKVDVIKNIAKSLKKINAPLVISHGSGSFGHTSAAKYCKKHGYTSKWGIAKVAFDAMTINNIVTEIFISEKLPAVSFRPMSHITAEKGKIKNSFFEPILLALEQGLIPVVYGDIIWDLEWKSTVFSGETTLNALGIYLQKKGYLVKKIIELCNVDGVLDSQGKVIPHINKPLWNEIKSSVGASADTDVTGGMRHKIEAALDLAKSGISTHIINGNSSGVLIDAINKKSVGTTISI